ncbi:MAG: alpha/beta fold hydrolase [Aestuariivita sp.]|nr:alpha/beta fold hydrolase [Aestuariivita sp.]MCY4202982.1 alpha/beta fold hydrolase [Aestuariivita sp.]
MPWPPPSDWPFRDESQQVYCSPHRWHIYSAGEGQTLLLLHGAGSSLHTFGNLIPILNQHYRVVAVDLPGQGFTQIGARHRCGLASVAADLMSLCQQQEWEPTALIGHSAGAALALELSRAIEPTPKVVGINPALSNFRGMAGVLFPAIAKFLALTPGVTRFVAHSGNRTDRVASLLERTGSRLDAKSVGFYRQLFSSREHIDGTLLMMSQWPAGGLNTMWSTLATPTLFLAGKRDRTVPNTVAHMAAEKMPAATVIEMADLGHLAHEEDAARVATHIDSFLTDPASC